MVEGSQHIRAKAIFQQICADTPAAPGLAAAAGRHRPSNRFVARGIGNRARSFLAAICEASGPLRLADDGARPGRALRAGFVPRDAHVFRADGTELGRDVDLARLAALA